MSGMRVRIEKIAEADIHAVGPVSPRRATMVSPCCLLPSGGPLSVTPWMSELQQLRPAELAPLLSGTHGRDQFQPLEHPVPPEGRKRRVDVVRGQPEPLAVDAHRLEDGHQQPDEQGVDDGIGEMDPSEVSRAVACGRPSRRRGTGRDGRRGTSRRVGW